MPEKEVDNSMEMSVSSALERFRPILVGVLAVAVLAVVGVVVGISVHGKAVESGIEQIDTVEFVLLKDAASLSGDELSSRLEDAAAQLAPLSGKGGIVGSRASMLLADVRFQQGKFAESREAWVRAAELGKGAYTSPFSYYNAGVCSERLGEQDKAASFYESASADAEFPLVDHVLFSLGRVQEGRGDFAAAAAAYTRLGDLRPSSKWADLAKSRMIALRQVGKVE